jgi:AAA+ ATPase superfamily predicted ATPase
MIISTVGNFVCLLGGKSTGKSFVIRHFEENDRNTVFVVDLRKHGGDILKGLLQVLKERRNRYIDLAKEIEGASILARALTIFTKNKYYSEILKIIAELEKVLGNELAVKSLPSLIEELINHRGNITLIIDESNIAFNITKDTTTEEIKGLKEALAMFTLMTKQSRQV